jgi:hypothetical protein
VTLALLLCVLLTGCYSGSDAPPNTEPSRVLGIDTIEMTFDAGTCSWNCYTYAPDKIAYCECAESKRIVYQSPEWDAYLKRRQ